MNLSFCTYIVFGDRALRDVHQPSLDCLASVEVGPLVCKLNKSKMIKGQKFYV